MMAGGGDSVGSDAIQQLGALVSPSQFHWTSGKMGEKCLAKTFLNNFCFLPMQMGNEHNIPMVL